VLGPQTASMRHQPGRNTFDPALLRPGTEPIHEARRAASIARPEIESLSGVTTSVGTTGIRTASVLDVLLPGGAAQRNPGPSESRSRPRRDRTPSWSDLSRPSTARREKQLSICDQRSSADPDEFPDEMAASRRAGRSAQHSLCKDPKGRTRSHARSTQSADAWIPTRTGDASQSTRSEAKERRAASTPSRFSDEVPELCAISWNRVGRELRARFRASVGEGHLIWSGRIQIVEGLLRTFSIWH